MRWPLSRNVKDPRAYLMESVEGFYWDGFVPPNDDMRGRLARVQQEGNISRVLYFFSVGKTIVFTNGFTKKTPKTPPAEIELAKKYRVDYERRQAQK